MKKLIICTLAVILICGCFVGTTIAWLMDQTEEVENTFTAGDINIELAETTGNTYKMVPGATIEKDPTVTVKAESEKCYLFVKIEKGNNFDTYMTYAIADGWTELQAGVYYRVVESSDADQAFNVLAGNVVTVKSEMTKAQAEAANANKPTLTFTAYACQFDNVADAATAWSYFNPSN